MSRSVRFQETRDDGDDVGMGETFVGGVNSCESVCEDASHALETGGVLIYSAVFDSPLLMSGEGDFLHLRDKEAITC